MRNTQETFEINGNRKEDTNRKKPVGIIAGTPPEDQTLAGDFCKGCMYNLEPDFVHLVIPALLRRTIPWECLLGTFFPK